MWRISRSLFGSIFWSFLFLFSQLVLGSLRLDAQSVTLSSQELIELESILNGWVTLSQQQRTESEKLKTEREGLKTDIEELKQSLTTSETSLNEALNLKTALQLSLEDSAKEQENLILERDIWRIVGVTGTAIGVCGVIILLVRR